MSRLAADLIAARQERAGVEAARTAAVERADRMAELARDHTFATVVGDLNVGHRELDIKNWKGNVKRAGFLPRERAYFEYLRGGGEEGSSHLLTAAVARVPVVTIAT